MDGLAQAHIQLPSSLSNVPITCAGARTIISGNVKTSSPVSSEKSHRCDLPKPHVPWCASVWSRSPFHAALDESLELRCLSIRNLSVNSFHTCCLIIQTCPLP